MKRRDPLCLMKWINWYPPLLGAGIRVTRIAPDLRMIRVEMKLTRLNLNAVGTHFGGSLYAMCDPWFMLMLMHALGEEYIVWDKSANIQFLRPGRGTVAAEFCLTQEMIDDFRARADAGEKIEPTFGVDVKNADGEIVAHVDKLLYIRKKNSR